MKTLKTILVTFFLTATLNAQYTAFKVEVVGTGEPVLLFPGFSCTGEVWNETVAELSKTHQCHIFTFAGFGGVTPIELPWLPKIKDEVIAYVKNKNLQKPTIIGHSLGGTLGFWLASEETTLFKKVIAVDALPASGALMVPNYKSENMVYDNPQSKMMLEMNDEAFTAMANQMASFMVLNKEKVPQLVNWMKTADRTTYVYGYVDLLKLDLREAIANIKIPVTVLAATYPDKKMIETTYNAQFAKLPSVQIEYADNAAHFVMYDQPNWYLAKIKQQLQ